VSFFR